MLSRQKFTDVVETTGVLGEAADGLYGTGSTPPPVNWRTPQPRVSHAENLNSGPKGECSSGDGNSGVQCGSRGREKIPFGSDLFTGLLHKLFMSSPKDVL